MKSVFMILTVFVAQLSLAGGYVPPDCGGPVITEEIKVSQVSSIALAAELKAYKTERTCHNFAAKLPGVQLVLTTHVNLGQAVVSLTTIKNGGIINDLFLMQTEKNKKSVQLDFTEGSIYADALLNGELVHYYIRAASGYIDAKFMINK